MQIITCYLVFRSAETILWSIDPGIPSIFNRILPRSIFFLFMETFARYVLHISIHFLCLCLCHFPSLSLSLSLSLPLLLSFSFLFYYLVFLCLLLILFCFCLVVSILFHVAVHKIGFNRVRLVINRYGLSSWLPLLILAPALYIIRLMNPPKQLFYSVIPHSSNQTVQLFQRSAEIRKSNRAWQSFQSIRVGDWWCGNYQHAADFKRIRKCSIGMLKMF